MKKSPTTNPFKLMTNMSSSLGTTLFIVFIVAGLIVYVLNLTNIISGQSTESATPTTTNTITIFNQTTIDRLNKLNTSDNNTGNQAPTSGRTNPFSE